MVKSGLESGGVKKPQSKLTDYLIKAGSSYGKAYVRLHQIVPGSSVW